MSERPEELQRAPEDAGDHDHRDGHAQDQNDIVERIPARSTKSLGDAGDDHAHQAPHGASSDIGEGGVPLLLEVRGCSYAFGLVQRRACDLKRRDLDAFPQRIAF